MPYIFPRSWGNAPVFVNKSRFYAKQEQTPYSHQKIPIPPQKYVGVRRWQIYRVVNFASNRGITLGSEVATLANEELGAGSHEQTLHASMLSEGTYFYTLTIGAVRETKKISVVQ